MIPPEAHQHNIARHLEPVQALLADPQVSEVMVTDHCNIFAERAGRIARSPAQFRSPRAVTAALNAIAQFSGKPFGPLHPILEGRLPDGSRVAGAVAPACPAGPTLSIRRFVRSSWSLEALRESGCVDEPAHRLLAEAAQRGRTVLVAGGTGTGKTSLLTALLAAAPAWERVLVVEDCREIQSERDNVVYLETQPRSVAAQELSLKALLAAALRLRPDRIVVGEVRGAEALQLLTALGSGHRGSLASLHASSPLGALARLETLASEAEARPRAGIVRQQIADAVDLVVQVERSAEGERFVARIEQVKGLDAKGNYSTAALYERALGRPTPARAGAKECQP